MEAGRARALVMLHRFLLHSLEQNELVQATTLRLLARLHEDGLLSMGFSDQELVLLRHNIAGLGGSELIDAARAGLEGFIAGR